MTGLPENELEPILASLVRKEVLSLSADPLSPERGQYGFLQDLVKKVAYDTMSRRERKARHLAAATTSLSVTDEDEIAEVVAAHLLDAYRAAPDDPDAAEVRVRARTALAPAGDRAASLARARRPSATYERAAELADEASAQAELLEQAGVMAADGGRGDDAASLFERSFALFEQEGQLHHGRARLGTHRRARLEPRPRLRRRRAHGALVRRARRRRAGRIVRRARGAARAVPLLLRRGRRRGRADRGRPRPGGGATTSRRCCLRRSTRKPSRSSPANGVGEGAALLRHALEVALDHELPSAALRAYYNLADVAIHAGASHDGRSSS